MPQREVLRCFLQLARLRWGTFVVITLASLLPLSSIAAADVTLQDLQELFLTGQYRECIEVGEANLQQQQHSQYWRVMLIKAYLAVGEVDKATTHIDVAMERFSRSVALRWIQYELDTANGDHEAAAEELKAIDDYAGPRLRYLQDPENLVLLGRAALAMGAEPKLVLDNFFRRAQRADPKYAEAWLAAGELALEKHDFELAATTFQNGLKEIPDHPDLLYGLAQAYFPSERAVMLESLVQALNVNTNHVPSHLLLADHLIDAEDYAAASKQLDLVLKVNPISPEAWAYRAVIAHVNNEPNIEESAREKALAVWKRNPMVDHLIGKKLSLKYRFKEGAEHQRLALTMRTNYLPAKVQLAQDLLRLGQDEAGWALADEVNKEDGYDITAFNLVTLRDQYKRFTTLTNEHFIVRMESGEAEVFGPRVLDLLTRAHAELTKKYGVTLETPTLVEIFSDARDFAVRTFGMPGNPGYLGVCFGNVITANSPTSPAGRSASWESVLWHEFCHVITLNMTHNKMPRWLSEGISVYEELEADGSWGQKMDPEFRDLILSGKMKPVSELSAAFLTAGSNTDLQFAYYQSTLVVEFLVKTYGFENLKSILTSLGEGIEINEAIGNHTAAIEAVDEQFTTFAEARAKSSGRGFEWSKPDVAEAGVAQISALLPNYPVNYWVLTGAVEEYIAAKKWDEAAELLDTMFSKGNGEFDTAAPYILQAAIYRQNGRTVDEFISMKQAAAIDGNQLDIFLRLLEISQERQDWEDINLYARRALGMNPTLISAYQALAESAEQLGRPEDAIAAYETILKLDPLNPASVHFSAARLQQESDPDRAKRHLLFALESAPRYRAAHQLLLKVNSQLAQLTTPTELQPTTETDTTSTDSPQSSPTVDAPQPGFE